MRVAMLLGFAQSAPWRNPQVNSATSIRGMACLWGGIPMLHRREFIQASAGAVAAVGLPGAARAAAWKTIDAQVHCLRAQPSGAAVGRSSRPARMR